MHFTYHLNTVWNNNGQTHMWKSIYTNQWAVAAAAQTNCGNSKTPENIVKRKRFRFYVCLFLTHRSVSVGEKQFSRFYERQRDLAIGHSVVQFFCYLKWARKHATPFFSIRFVSAWQPQRWWCRISHVNENIIIIIWQITWNLLGFVVCSSVAQTHRSHQSVTRCNGM